MKSNEKSRCFGVELLSFIYYCANHQYVKDHSFFTLSMLEIQWAVDKHRSLFRISIQERRCSRLDLFFIRFIQH
jgi:hypothetical protein